MQHDDAPSTRPQVPFDEDWLPPDDDWLTEAGAWWSEALQQDGAGFRERMAAAAKLPAPDAAERPEQVDPVLFNRHVVADLDALIRGYACFVRLDMCSYAEALGATMGYAWRKGAWGFNPTHLADLRDWLRQRLGDAIGPEAG